MPDPTTPAEWQSAVDSAAFCLAVAALRQYGLITGGPTFNSDRAHDLLARGAALGYQPAAAKDLVARFVAEGV